MLDEKNKSDLWRAIRRMDRGEKMRLVNELQKSLEADEDGGGADEAARQARWKRECDVMDEIRGRTSLEGTSIKSLIEEGRRF